MEILIILLLLFLIGLVLFLLFGSSRRSSLDETIRTQLNDRFIGFQDMVHKTIDGARREVEMSKNVISDHAVKTLGTINDMSTTLERMMHQQKEAQELGKSLKYLLQTPKLRGSYGETILEEMLEKVLPGMWKKQYSIDSNERVDAVVIYKDVVIPIDAKFPREIYEKYMNSHDEEKKRNWKLYEDGIKVQIQSIKNKYIKPHKGTSDFALMFIPSESIHYETIAEKNFLGEPCSIYEYARDNKVIPVSPNTLYAFLQVVIMGIRNLEIIKSAKKLQDALVKIERNFKNFYSKYEEIGLLIEKAGNAYKVGDAHINRFKTSVDSTIQLDLPDRTT